MSGEQKLSHLLGVKEILSPVGEVALRAAAVGKWVEVMEQTDTQLNAENAGVPAEVAAAVKAKALEKKEVKKKAADRQAIAVGAAMGGWPKPMQAHQGNGDVDGAA